LLPFFVVAHNNTGVPYSGVALTMILFATSTRKVEPSINSGKSNRAIDWEVRAHW
jgi:hypothetical protein